MNHTDDEPISRPTVVARVCQHEDASVAPSDIKTSWRPTTNCTTCYDASRSFFAKESGRWTPDGIRIIVGGLPQRLTSWAHETALMLRREGFHSLLAPFFHAIEPLTTR